MTIQRIGDKRVAIVELEIDHLVRAVRGVRIRVAIGIGEYGLIHAVPDREITVAALEQTLGTSSEFRDFVVGQSRFAFELFRSLERSRAIADPDALQIRLAI